MKNGFSTYLVLLQSLAITAIAILVAGVIFGISKTLPNPLVDQKDMDIETGNSGGKPPAIIQGPEAFATSTATTTPPAPSTVKKTKKSNIVKTTPLPAPSATKKANPTPTPSPAPTSVPPPAPDPTPTPPPVVADWCQVHGDENYFYQDAGLQAARVERDLLTQGRAAEADTLREISCRPQGIWVIGGTPAEAGNRTRAITQAAEAKGQVPIIVLYNVPDHYSLKWWSGVVEHTSWVAAAADGIGVRPAWIILEPDAISLSFNLNATDRGMRLKKIGDAVAAINTRAPNAKIFLDGGHSNWRTTPKQASALALAGIENADGFFLNVANYRSTADEIIYGTAISKLVHNKHFIIDTSRNGNVVTTTDWCNTPGVAIGRVPTKTTGNFLVDAFLWIKPPGESDGYCNGGPGPGKFWLERALDMIRRSH